MFVCCILNVNIMYVVVIFVLLRFWIVLGEVDFCIIVSWYGVLWLKKLLDIMWLFYFDLDYKYFIKIELNNDI